MHLSHIEAKIGQQVSLSQQVRRSLDDLYTVGEQNISRYRLETRSSALQEDWSEFAVNHKAINIAIAQLNAEDRKQIDNNSYFRHNMFNKTRDAFLEASEKMSELSDSVHGSRGTSTHSDAVHFENNTPRIHQNHNLPRLDLPKFDGNQENWLTFKDMFQSMVIDNRTISLVEKLQYLKSSLTGTASQLLLHTPLVGNNFEKAWNDLGSYYDNKRVLIDASLNAILSIKRMSKESASELEQLLSTMNQNLRTLETLQQPVHHWDTIIIHWTVKQLHPNLVRAWEHELGSWTEYPTWDKLKRFILTRIRSLQAMERASGTKPIFPSKPQIRTHYSTTSESNMEINTASASKNCTLCPENHFLWKCPQFAAKTSQQKTEFIKQKGLCFNCLNPHKVASCPSTNRCRKCGKKHHTTIHRGDTKSFVSTTEPKTLFTQPVINSIEGHSTSLERTVNHVISNEQGSSPTLLATARVQVLSKYGQSVPARVLVDQGSEVSLVSEALAQKLDLPRKNVKISVVGVGAHKSGRTRGLVEFSLKPNFQSPASCEVTAYVLPKLTTNIPSTPVSIDLWPHLQGIKLADPTFNYPGQIDILLGADCYGQILENKIKKGTERNSPIAQLTIFGWIISGPSNLNSKSSPTTIQEYHCHQDQELYKLLEKFWLQEEIPSTEPTLSPEEQQCEDHFKSTYYRTPEGRYVLRLPFKLNHPLLGDSKEKALKRLNQLFFKFNSNPAFHESYQQFISEYESLGHMKVVPATEPEQSQSFYLPHHGVFRESSVTTKLRVVFNGSSKSNNGISLNEILCTGAKLQNNLFNVLLWFRQYRFAFSTDIEKMYRQIMIHPDDWKYQRILWKNSSGIHQRFNLTTVTYGLNCAPFLALRTLNQLVKDEEKRYPLSASCLTKGRYVDDIFGGGNTIEETQKVVEQVSQLCIAGGFIPKKWASNAKDVLQPIPVERQYPRSLVHIEEPMMIHTLGLVWRPEEDSFHFLVKPDQTNTIATKRTILSRVAQLFDPMGFISPVLLLAKIILQELWTIHVGWDDPVPKTQSERWSNFQQALPELSKLSIPRWIGNPDCTEIQIHGFSDASQVGLSAAIYLRSSGSQKVTITLICAKTKVSPLKKMTIPRLELAAATLLTKLTAHTVKTLELNCPVYLWTDSSIVYTWITSHPSKWKEYVHNRVVMIQNDLPQAQWKLISGKDNPADCASRGMTPTELANHQLWWKGPPWLQSSPNDWQQTTLRHNNKDAIEEQRPKFTHMTRVIISEWETLLKYHGNLTRLLRVTATFLRAVTRFKCKRTIDNLGPTGPLTPMELKNATLFWVRHIQQTLFKDELKIISSGQQLQKSHPLANLTPFLKDGLLRVGGRLHNSLLPYESKHPLILPKDSIFSKLIIADAHNRTLHGSIQATVSFIRATYWIIGGRAPVRSYILKCMKCTIYRRRAAQQMMGALPSRRVTPSLRPFFHSGIDYAGPFILKAWAGRKAKEYKGFIALFVCMTTSALHLELVSSYSTDAFLAAYRRFTSRRGICKTLSSDCGSNLKGADSELQRLFSSASKELDTVANLIANDGTQWIFNPPSAPHFGGKWEAGVKSVKHHLKRVVGDTVLTYEEMTTFLNQIEAILNSRPLCPLTNDPDDLEILTPGHFLIGQALNVVPEPSLEDININRLSRWQNIQQKMSSFWAKWQRECLQRYQAIYKWNHSTNEIKPGTLVLILDERYPPSKWPLARVIEVHPGKDGLVRVATVKTSHSTYTRPVVKLCPLPVENDTL